MQRFLIFLVLVSALSWAGPTWAAPRAKASANQIADLVESAFGSIWMDSGLEDADIELDVRAALNVGATPNARTKGGDTLLLQAVFNNRLSVARLLIKRGADVNLPGEDGDTPLIRASSINDPLADKPQSLTPMVQLLLQHKADPNRRNTAGETALTLAALWGRGNVVKALLEGKANFQLANRAGVTPLQLALIPVERGSFDVMVPFPLEDTPANRAMMERLERAEEQRIRLGRANAARWLREAGAKK